MLEKRLIRKMLDGDEQSHRRFVDAHYDAILRFLTLLTASREDGQELTQETFVRVKQSLAHFRGDSSLRTWLRRIAYHEFLHWKRTVRQRVPLTDTNLGAKTLSDEALVLWQEIDALPDGIREAFVLREVDQLSVREVAAILEIPEGTVKSRCYLAKKSLRETLAPAWGMKVENELQENLSPCD